MNRNWLLTVSYDGTAYHGWQRQPQANTVQAELERAFERLFGTPIVVEGCSRTDAGVHALSQMVTVAPPAHPPIPPLNARKALNDLLPCDIRVREIRALDTNQHARFDNCGKAYVYVLARRPVLMPFLRNFSWGILSAVDVGGMQGAAQALCGRHDFTTFSCLSDRDDALNERTIFRFDVQQVEGMLALSVVGDGFLYKMVRRLVGFLVAVGCGRSCADDVPRLLAARDRNAGFDTAPPQGLFLHSVFYTEAEREAWRLEGLPFLGH